MKKEKRKNLKEVIDIARGERSLTEFAADCDISRASMYRLAKGDIRTPLSDDWILRIMLNAEGRISKEDVEEAMLYELEEYHYEEEHKRRKERFEYIEYQLPLMIIGQLAANGIVLHHVGDVGYAEYIAQYQEREEHWTIKFKAVLDEGAWSPTSHLHRRMSILYQVVGEWILRYPQTQIPARLILFVLVDEDYASHLNGWVDTFLTMEDVGLLPVNISVVCVNERLELLSQTNLPGPTQDMIPILFEKK